MEKGHFLRGKVGYAVSLSDGSYVLESGEVISARKGAYQDFHHTRNVDSSIRENLMNMAVLYEEAIRCTSIMGELEDAIAKDDNAIAKLRVHSEKLAVQKEEVYKQKKVYLDEIQRQLCARQLELDITSQDVDENSKAKMSFYTGTLDIPRAIAIVKVNKKRKIYYRYGLGYRGAEKYEIGKEKAIEILKKNSSFTDFEAAETMILINQYSSNDMY